MDVQNDSTIEVDAPIPSKLRDQWIEQHARQVQHRDRRPGVSKASGERINGLLG
jgi:hypothetical protein